MKSKNNSLSKSHTGEFRGKLLGWYDLHHRKLPWRAPLGRLPDPYHEWLSEIMLQQTTVGAVIPYFLKFVKKWPDIHALAKAPQEEVMKEWAGLGYYARARNLHACARIVSEQLKGVFPDTEEELAKLPGIGSYTAAAITAIGFNKPAAPVDGNIERVMARYFAVEEPLPGSKAHLKELAQGIYKDFTARPGDLAQGLMELGATVCMPATPKCGECPVAAGCAGRRKGVAASLPVKVKKARPRRYGHVYWITDRQGRVLLHRRPQKGLLGGMAGLPTSTWEENPEAAQAPEALQKLKFGDFGKNVTIRHVFTHFDLELRLKEAKAANLEHGDYFWAERKAAAGEGLPTAFRKAFDIFNR